MIAEQSQANCITGVVIPQPAQFAEFSYCNVIIPRGIHFIVESNHRRLRCFVRPWVYSVVGLARGGRNVPATTEGLATT